VSDFSANHRVRFGQTVMVSMMPFPKRSLQLSDWSAATRRRSRCGSVRGWPVLSSHFSPTLAPHVGQRTASTCFGVAFIPTSCSDAQH